MEDTGLEPVAAPCESAMFPVDTNPPMENTRFELVTFSLPGCCAPAAPIPRVTGWDIR